MAHSIIIKDPITVQFKSHCKSFAVSSLLAVFMASANIYAQDPLFIHDTLFVENDTVRFAALIPGNYSSDAPPAIVIWWHQLGGLETEIFDFTDIDTVARDRGWIVASHFGPNDRHWNARRPQMHCQYMLEWIDERYPFSHDSIYMIGGSMGGAAGQVWHNNNCGMNDYLIAATAGGSQISDCQLRQEQYLAALDTNRSMRAAFGGLPSESDSAAFEYHRYSAIYLADPDNSMYFNSLNLPVWSSWGEDAIEWYAYGDPAQIYYPLRGTTDPFSRFFPSGLWGAHGLDMMFPDSICNWLSQFSVNRFPDELSISADENDSYYYTKAYLGEEPYVFGRYTISKHFDERRLDISAIRNIRSLAIAMDPAWTTFDEITGTWQNLDANVPDFSVRLCSVPPVAEVTLNGTQDVPFQYDDGDLIIAQVPNGEIHIEFVQGIVSPAPIEPTAFVTATAFPNPFNLTTTIEFQNTAEMSDVLKIYDILGRVAAEIPVTFHAGKSSVSINAELLSNGIYFVTSSAMPSPLKIMLLK